MPLEDDVVLYPAHGAGTLCGKGLSKANSSTMGQEKKTNWSLQPMTEDEFVASLLSDQPFIPAYFPYDVEVNRKGAAPFKQSIEAVAIGEKIQNEKEANRLKKDVLVVDTRNEKAYKKGHLAKSINLMDGAKFETWLGSILQPGEKFYLAGDNEETLKEMIARAAAIGYEPFIEQAFVLDYAERSDPVIDVDAFRNHTEDYTIVDVRNESEVKERKPFKNSLAIPLPQLRKRTGEIPTDKPIVVHCAGGYRSAAGSSIIKTALNGQVKVFDLSEAIKEFQK